METKMKFHIKSDKMDFSRFDIFPKLDSEYRIGTSTGGLLSILSIAAISLLSFSEIKIYKNPPTRQRLFVDTSRPTGEDGVTISMNALPHLDVTANITFPSLPAYFLHFDVLDSFTQLPSPIDGLKKKFIRIKKDGKEEEFNFNDFYLKNVTECGKCYKVNTTKKCCNSCFDAIDEFSGNPEESIKFSEAEQCKELVDEFEKMKGEGTRVELEFRVPKTASEFHICPGVPSVNMYGIHSHNFKAFGVELGSLNLSHHITTLHFSKNKTSLLDNFTLVQNENKSLGILYQLDILGNSFSASKFVKYNPTSFPVGVTFFYDISPINAIKYKQKETPIHLISRLVTVIGGVLCMFKILDSILFAARKNNDNISK